MVSQSRFRFWHQVSGSKRNQLVVATTEMSGKPGKLWSFRFFFRYKGPLVGRATVAAFAASDPGAYVINVFARLKVKAAISALWANRETDTSNNFGPRHLPSPIDGLAEPYLLR